MRYPYVSMYARVFLKGPSSFRLTAPSVHRKPTGISDKRTHTLTDANKYRPHAAPHDVCKLM